MSRSNSWSNPSMVPDAEAIQMAAFLEEHSHTPDVQAVNEMFCKVLDPKTGEWILEVGCGSGIICRLIAPHIQPGGIMVGVDISPVLIGEAKKYARLEGVTDQINFECGKGESLPYPAGTFDSVCAARLLLHASDPNAILNEMVRLTKPGGRVLVMDWDFESVVVDHPNRELTRRLLHWRNDHRGGDNWSGRHLWRCMKNAGLQRLTVHPYVSVAYNESDGFTQSLWRAAHGARDNGAITPEEHDGWIGELKKRINEETFFASIMYLIVKGFAN
jgi:ubiquinone/menaquinone biosynthesis C-methylase UbiE